MEAHQLRLTMSATEENTRAVHRITEEDSRQTVDEITSWNRLRRCSDYHYWWLFTEKYQQGGFLNFSQMNRKSSFFRCAITMSRGMLSCNWSLSATIYRSTTIPQKVNGQLWSGERNGRLHLSRPKLDSKLAMCSFRFLAYRFPSST